MSSSHASPGQAAGLAEKGQQFYRQRKLDQARLCYEQALQLQPQQVDWHLALGTLLSEQGQHAQALASFEQALRWQPDHLQALQMAGNTLCRLGRLQEARKYHTQALHLQPEAAGLWHNLGVVLLALGQLSEAAQHFRQALRLQPDHLDAAGNLAITLAEQGLRDEAIALYRQVLCRCPSSAVTHNNLGVALARQGRRQEAIASYREALRLQSDYADAQSNLATALRHEGRHAEASSVLQQAQKTAKTRSAAQESYLSPAQRLHEQALQRAAQGQLEEACQQLQEALDLQPDFLLARCSLAAFLERQGKPEEACRHFKAIVLAEKHAPTALLPLGRELAQHGKLPQAIACFELALEHFPQEAELHVELGLVLASKECFPAAAATLEQALKLRPQDDSIRMHLGNVLRQARRLDEAEACFRDLLERQPGSAHLHNMLGVTLLDQGKPCEAERSFWASIGCLARNAQAFNNLGVVLEQQGKTAEAIGAYQEAVRLDPDCADTHKNMALSLLVQGDFRNGWPAYEWRWKCAVAAKRSWSQPRWDGSPLEGKVILLHAEQGLGDTLQMIRYVPLVRQRGGIVVVEAQGGLVPLLRRCAGIHHLVAQGEPLPHFDVQAPLFSLPYLFQTTLESVPASVPYLSADPERLEYWGSQLRPYDGFKVGIAWQGSRKYQADRLRSLPLRHFAPLAKVQGVRLFSLQKGYGSEQLAEVAAEWGIIDLGSRLDEGGEAFMDTAAVLSHLDLVISSDTSLVHLAGALAAPVWMATTFACDWRWLLERQDSPWYPTLRLFRQHSCGDWDGVFARIAEELRRQLERTGMRQPLWVEMAPGELLDKITILQIKRQRIEDAGKRANVCIELGALQAARARSLPETAALAGLVDRLQAVNEQLWDVEEQLRLCEAQQDFGSHFVELARSVYRLNDERARLKRRINECCGSCLIEEKSYGAAA